MPATPPGSTYIDAFLEQARTTRDRTVEDFGGLDARAVNWKPAPARWSVAQCLQHLIASNEEYSETFAAVANGTYRPSVFARIPLLPRVWGPLIRWAMTPGNRVKVPTTEALEPGESDIDVDIVDAFSASVDELLERIAALEHADQRQVVVESPFASFVGYSLGDAIAIAVAHLERHRLQAVRVTEMPGFPSDGTT